MLEFVKSILVILAAIALFLSSWVVLAAPTISLLPLGVGAPEISPILLLVHLIILVLGYLVSLRATGTDFTPLILTTDVPGTIILVFSIFGLGLSSIPLLQLPSTLRQAEQQMQQGLGADYLADIPARQQERMRSHPFNPYALVQGIDTPNIIPEQRSLSTPDGATLKVDIYHPVLDNQPLNPSSDKYSVLVTIYGGAWKSGDPKQKAQFNSYMAAQGYGVVALDYRHAPEYKFPTQINDVVAVLDWMTTVADEYSWDRDRVALIGWSAGGHLAMLAAYSPLLGGAGGGSPRRGGAGGGSPRRGGAGGGSITIKAVVNYYGPVDLAAGYADPPIPDPIDNRAVLELFLGGSPTQVPDTYRDASPITYVRPGLPPTLLVYGDRDHLVKPIFGYQLHDQLKAQGNRSILLRLPWAEHAFDAIFSGMGNQIALYHTERFLAWALHSR